MTDNEIIKALECCFIESGCNECPCYIENPDAKECLETVGILAIDLIKRQQAEIERLENRINEKNEEIDRISYALADEVKLKAEIKAEAIKEFAERLCADRVSNDPVVIAAKCLVKEMMEDV